MKTSSGAPPRLASGVADDARVPTEPEPELAAARALFAERTRALELAEALVGVAFDAGEALLVVDDDGAIVRANRRFLELWRVPEDVAATRSHAALRAWCANEVEDPAGVDDWLGLEAQEPAAEAADPGAARCETFTLRGGRVVEGRVRRARLGVGRAGHVFGFRDVTAQVRRDAELRANERRFRAIYEQAAVGVAEIDTATGRFVRINRKYEEILGYSAKEMPALDFMRITYPEDLAPDLARMELLKRGELREFTLEKRLLRKDGTPVWVNLTVSPMWAPGEAPTHHIAVVQDVGERKRAEARLFGIVEFAPDAVLMVDEGGRIVLANRVAEDTFGYTRAELLGLGVEELIPRSARRGHADLRRSFLEGRTARRMDAARSRVWALRKDGVKVPVEVSLSPLESDEGPLVVAVVRDVTERARAEQERAALEEELRQAQKMDALGSLAGGIAHDFNNLLTVILMNADLMRMAAQSGETPPLERIEAVSAAAFRGQDLIRQILAFSRKQPALRAVIAIPPVVDAAAALLRASIPAGVRLTTEIAPDLPPVLADRTQLHQVLVNLGTNAWHAIPRATGHIAFRADAIVLSQASERLGAGRYVRIEVEDDGVGMEPAVAAHVFEPFFTTKPVHEGTGLGLAIVHRIVTDHGGVVDFASVPQRGSTFSVYLPVATGAVEPSPSENVPPPECGGHVLLVDDDLLVLNAASRSLSSLGFQVTACAQPSDALAKLRADSTAFDVVVTDQNMPEMSGLELSLHIGRLRADLPVVLISGNLVRTDAELAAANVRRLLEKPFTGAQLSAVLAAVLKRG